MKNLQNNFTTYEQSKRLLELGVPDWTADCVTSRYGGGTFFEQDSHVFRKCIDSDNYVPCWSVGRLIEICKICEPKKDYEQLCEELQWSQNYCVVIISHIIANLPIIDFSKLEE